MKHFIVISSDGHVIGVHTGKNAEKTASASVEANNAAPEVWGNVAFKSFAMFFPKEMNIAEMQKWVNTHNIKEVKKFIEQGKKTPCFKVSINIDHHEIETISIVGIEWICKKKMVNVTETENSFGDKIFRMFSNEVFSVENIKEVPKYGRFQVFVSEH